MPSVTLHRTIYCSNSIGAVTRYEHLVEKLQYTLDLVYTVTGESVNMPSEWELWFVPPPSKFWLSFAPYRNYSLEHGFDVRGKDLNAGEEKFILKEGMICLLKRPGKKDVRFTVPVLKREERANYDTDDVIDFDFPEMIPEQ
ncbi:hypothetical protein K474DRAFT_976351 [Panus rudis PR-1116 ss-1]|nr:hypothetical protein K474DRAFT_976351 [Panus rudis PR-1116 ss-1]